MGKKKNQPQQQASKPWFWDFFVRNASKFIPSFMIPPNEMVQVLGFILLFPICFIVCSYFVIEIINELIFLGIGNMNLPLTPVTIKAILLLVIEILLIIKIQGKNLSIPKKDLVTSDYLVLKKLVAQLKVRFYPNRIEIEQGRIIKLDASFIDLKIFPQMICDLSHLRYLILSSNKLVSLPTELGSLKNLTDLNLNHNQLTTLPETIGQLPNLQTLKLSDNKLSSIPKTLGQLSNLQKLSVKNNKINFLQKTVLKQVKLQELDIRRNPLSKTALKVLQELKQDGVQIRTDAVYN
ncbi:MAG: leucine-rich repeat domain-containing protein [Promethearchaeota archaeon]